VTALSRVAGDVDPGLGPYVLEQPAGARYDDALDADRAYVLEAVREGYEMHYGTPRAFAGMDDDLRLLAGDALYAQGLSRLAELGDLPAVAELADLISLCAQAQAEGRTELVEDLWTASAAALAGKGPGARATVAERLARSS
jgi:hypothetical protein